MKDFIITPRATHTWVVVGDRFKAGLSKEDLLEEAKTFVENIGESYDVPLHSIFVMASSPDRLVARKHIEQENPMLVVESPAIWVRFSVVSDNVEPVVVPGQWPTWSPWTSPTRWRLAYVESDVGWTEEPKGPLEETVEDVGEAVGNAMPKIGGAFAILAGVVGGIFLYKALKD